MIIPRLYGRLGNQCFQVAAAIAHSKKMETGWYIPRNTQDARYWPNYFLREVPRANITFGTVTRDVYKEPRHAFDAIPTHTNSLTLDGYFQSEKYFADAKYEIGDALGFHCKQKDYIAIHVRRGDYVTQWSEKHPPLDAEYYSQAIGMFYFYGYDRFVVYSDEIDFCRRWLPVGKFKTTVTFEFSLIKDALTDMRDMYNASGFIISNSTFSLFPALLRLDNPVTIAPKEERWYGPENAHLETCDLMPERFLKM